MRVKIRPKAVLIPTISLFLICLVVTGVLALTNSVTADKIAENEAQSKQESMFAVVPDAVEFEEVEVKLSDGSFADSSVIYLGKSSSGDIVGCAVSTACNGYGGLIKVMTGFDTTGTILGVDVFYNDNETPGLGKNTSNADFRDQFKGLSAYSEIAVSKDSHPADAQTVDAVTSATISSRAVATAVNYACEVFKQASDNGKEAQ